MFCQVVVKVGRNTATRKRFVVILAFITVGINLVTAQSSSESQLPRERLNYFAGT
jgi:hypothetical protein